MGDKAGLLLEAGEVIEILSSSGFERNSFGEIDKGVIGVAFFGKKNSKFTSDFGRVGIKSGSVGDIGNGLGKEWV